MNSFNLSQEVPNRSNLPLQIFLWLNVYVFAAWSMIYGFYILYKISNFWNIEGLFVVGIYMATNVFECLRLYSGYLGNLKSKPMHLNRFLILTPLILLPSLLFLLIFAKDFKLLISYSTYSLFGLLCFEFIFGALTWQKLCAYQSQIYKLKREMIFQRETRRATTEIETKNFS